MGDERVMNIMIIKLTGCDEQRIYNTGKKSGVRI
jgi:hypothetical protein